MTNTSVPRTTRPQARNSAASGANSAIAAAVSSGPTVNISSTATESSANAVRRRSGRSCSSAGHSERITELSGGMVAPTSAAQATSAAAGAPARVSPTSASSDAACSSEAGTSTGRRPSRSISRPATGRPRPPPAAAAPATAPASA